MRTTYTNFAVAATTGASFSATPSTSIFSQLQQPKPANNMFGSGGLPNGGLFGNSPAAQAQSPAKSLFDTSQPKPDLFPKSDSDLGSRMTFPAAQALNTPSASVPSAGPGIWDAAPKPEVKAPTISWAQPSASTPATAPASSGNLFGRVGGANGGAEPAAPVNSLFGVQPKSTSTSLFGAQPTTTPTSPVKDNATLFQASSPFQSKPSTPGPQQTQATIQSNFTPSALGNSTPSLFSNLNKPVDPSLKFGFSAEGAQQPQNFSSPATPASSGLTNGNVAKITDHSLAKSEMAAVGEITDAAMHDLVPPEFTAKQRKQFYKAYRLRSLNKAMQNFFASLPSHVDPANAIAYFTEMRQAILGRAAVSGSKRQVNGVENPENGAENSSKRGKADLDFGPTQTESSASPLKSSAQQSETQPSVHGVYYQTDFCSATPTQTPSLPAPTNPQLFGGNSSSSSTSFSPFQSANQSGVSSPAKSKRKADDELTKDIFEAKQREISKAPTPSTEAASGRSNTSALFQSIAESPAKSGPEKKIKSLPSAISSSDEVKRPNPFAAIPTSPTKPKAPAPAATPVALLPANELFAPKTTPSTPNLFAPKQAAAPSTVPAASSNNLFGAKSTGATNPFQPAASTNQAPTFGAKSTTTGNPFQPAAPSTAQAPKFGAPVNFLAQFGQKAAKDKEAHEKKLMEEAEAADYDSDEEDLKSWRAKYKLKRKAELEEIEKIAKISKPKYDPGKGFTFDSAPAASDKPTTIGSSNFLDRNSASGTSSPARSIFETGTPPVADFDNPFSKFAQSTDQDDSDSEEAQEDEKSRGVESDGEADDEVEVDADSENKDPNYQPGQEASGPGTPVEETGVGIVASNKKGGLFSFANGSGAFDQAEKTDNSPTAGKSAGSLFDRVSFPRGHPMATSSDEKENTKPAETKSIFGNSTQSFGGSFGSASGEPADKTWNQTKGINFASSVPPSVNVTSATPTKPASGGLFGNSKASTPGASLFGSATAPSTLFNFGASPSAGFNFGAPASGTSSLLPSTAVSNSTSRATTPGATSDDAEADPDGVKHTQADFTRGAGEEDEDVLFESKARASRLKGKEWVKYVGIVRVLKHKETGATRILHRREPSAAVVMNYSIPNTKYTSTKSSLAMVLVEADGKFSTWSITVKTPQEAEELVAVLNEHKNA